MYNIQQDLGNYIFIPVIEATDGTRYGTMAFRHEAPSPAHIQEIIAEFDSDGISDWNVHDIILTLLKEGYECDMVIESGTEYWI